jgi:rare lipoprotein A
MARLSRCRAVAPLVLVAAIGITVPALAQDPPDATPKPVIGYAPKEVAFSDRTKLRGHVNDAAAGDEVALERKFAGKTWEVIRSRALSSRLKVTFTLEDPVHSARYRLRHVASDSVSEPERIVVRPRLKVRLRPRHALMGRRVRIQGGLWPAVGGRRVVIERRSAGLWRRVDRGRAGDGRFSAAFGAGERIGRMRLRIRFLGDRLNPAAERTRRLTVYDPDVASWYGPGLYGGETACGHTLTPDTLGVAHRSLPCGTKVRLLFRGRTITVPVVDRGPYGASEWDLTGATAGRLDFGGRGTIGTAVE